MKERPILFTAPMVRALLDGSKTQTRRIVKRNGKNGCAVYSDPIWEVKVAAEPHFPGHSHDFWRPGAGRAYSALPPCPYGQPGDRLWVRETHRPVWGQTPGYLIGVDYKADPQEKWERMRDHAGRPNWTPSVHIRRAYSRILLEITCVRVERLQDISDADAKAEGIEPHEVRQFSIYGASPAERAAIYRDAAVGPYRGLWESINGAGSWATNPWVWVLEFRRITP